MEKHFKCVVDSDRGRDLLNRQAYRLAYWWVASDEINYRRFFDINELAALSMERPEVFAATHELIFRLLREGKVTGLRIDRSDGLFDPRQYLQRLSVHIGRRSAAEGGDALKVLFIGEGPHDIGRSAYNTSPGPASGTIPTLACKVCPSITEPVALRWADLARFNPDARKRGLEGKVSAAVLLGAPGWKKACGGMRHGCGVN